MTANELNAMADRWHSYAIEEAARVNFCVKSHHAREWAVEADAMFNVAGHLRLAAYCAAQGGVTPAGDETGTGSVGEADSTRSGEA